MSVLVVYAHPPGKSHAEFTLDVVEKDLKKRKIKYKVIDLYKDKFNPVLYFDKKTKLQEKYEKMFFDATHHIIIYPVWWNGMPAILKGFYDQVLVAGKAFTYKRTPIPKFGIPVKLLKGRAVSFTTTGSLNVLHTVFQWSIGRRAVVVDCLKFCGIKGRTYHTGGATRFDDSNKRKITRNVASGLSWLFKA